jgi:hypothetical protein
MKSGELVENLKFEDTDSTAILDFFREGMLAKIWPRPRVPLSLALFTYRGEVGKVDARRNGASFTWRV